MKVKCIRLLNDRGETVESYNSSLALGCNYHVMSVYIDSAGKRAYAIITSEKEMEWPAMVSHPSECFEIISEIVPSNWRVWIGKDFSLGISPAAWQEDGFQDAFYDHDPKTYPIFERERDLIRKEDP